MRKFLKIIGIVLLTLVCGLAGFVWWALQPGGEPLTLPEELIALDSADGQALLASAELSADYTQLQTSYVSQQLKSYCGVASGVAVLNALGRDTSQDDFFDTATANQVRSRWQVTFGGMALPELAGLIKSHGVIVRMVHAQDVDLDAFRAVLESNMDDSSDYLLVNYQREVLGQGRVGHISPIAAYDRASDRVLIMDTASYKYPPTWVPVQGLFLAMLPLDSETGKSRGYIEVSR